MVCVVETGLITPPFGINVFVLKGIAGGDVPMWTIFRGVMPFVGADLVKLALLTIFPAVALWLPSTMVN
jgi:TRAP-type C4-dicarboxylate transport system permease large subunit